MKTIKYFQPDDGKKLPVVMVIVGPTAVGKSNLALEMASRLDGEIVSADSAQVRHLNVGTAKPSLSEQERIKHHLIDIIDPDTFSVAHYQKLALSHTGGIIRRKAPHHRGARAVRQIHN